MENWHLKEQLVLERLDRMRRERAAERLFRRLRTRQRSLLEAQQVIETVDLKEACAGARL